MTGQHSFDERYWSGRWEADGSRGPAAMAFNPPHPYLLREIGDLSPGSALEAGCGAGSEAIWLASRGWEVTGADIADGALALAAERAAARGLADRVRWIKADLSRWEPRTSYDLVTTHYAHPAIPQLEFYDRLASWVGPGGTLLIVGHRHHGHDHAEEGEGPPASASVTASDITARLASSEWRIATAEEPQRRIPGRGADALTLHDVVVRAVRRS